MLYSQQIDGVIVFKYLGVMLDEQLVWKDHIDYVARKVSQRIRLLRWCAKPVLPEEVLKMLCCSLIMPLIDYCDVAWSNSSVTLLDKLIKLYNRMARMILNAHPRKNPYNRYVIKEPFIGNICLFDGINIGWFKSLNVLMALLLIIYRMYLLNPVIHLILDLGVMVLYIIQFDYIIKMLQVVHLNIWDLQVGTAWV